MDDFAAKTLGKLFYKGKLEDKRADGLVNRQFFAFFTKN